MATILKIMNNAGNLDTPAHSASFVDIFKKMQYNILSSLKEC